MIVNLRDFTTKAKTRANPGGLPSINYAVAATGDSLRELFDCRTQEEAMRLVDRADVLGLLVRPSKDRRTRWVRLPGKTGERKKMYVFQGNALSLRRALRVDRYDNPPESSGTRVRVLTWR